MSVFTLLLIALLILIASIPGLYAWWRGRRVSARPDDGLLAERMAGERKRSTVVMISCCVLLGILGGLHLMWALPLAVVLLIAADYPARRHIYGETWTLPGFLWFWFRWSLAFGGFWTLLAATPWAIHLAGEHRVLVTVVMAAALLLLNARFDRVFLRLLGARPLQDPALVDAFAPVIARASVAPPRISVAEEPGGFLPMAFALPGTPGGVLFYRSLLDRLPQRETVAVFAHEVAHLEQFTPRVLRKIAVATFALIAAAVSLPHIVGRVAPGQLGLAVLLWPFAVLGLVMLRTRLYRPLEIDGDRRAAELCGDPETMASALIRLYAIAYLPRRLDVEVERWASHPSLARRVQALRALAGTSTAEAREPVTFATTGPAGTVTFESDGLRIGAPPAGAAATTTREALTRYRDLHELRLELPVGKSPQLVGRDRGGRLIRVGVRAEDAAGIQRVLDQVDTLLAPDLPSGATATVRQAGVIAAVTSLVALFWVSTVPAFFAAALATFRSSVPTLAGAGVAGLAGGGIAWWAGGRIFDPGALVLIGLGGALIVMAIRGRRADLDTSERLVAIGMIAFLALGALVSWTTGVLLPGASALRLHRLLGMGTGVVVFPLSLAALLYAWAAGRSPLRRLSWSLAVPLTFVGLVPVLAASPMFFRAAVDDPLVAPAQRYQIVRGDIDIEHEFHLDAHGGVRLSPNGGWISVAPEAEEDSESLNEAFVLLARDGRRLEASAAELAFVDEAHVLTLSGDAAGWDLALRRLEPGVPVTWSERLPAIGLDRLDVSTARRTWRVSGWTPGGEAVRLAGSIGAAGHEERHWSAPDSEGRDAIWFLGAGETAVRLEGYEHHSVASVLAFGTALHFPGTGYRRIIVAEPSGERPIESELRTHCVDAPIGAAAVTCTAFDGVDSRVFGIVDRVLPLGVVRGALWLSDHHEDGTVQGFLDRDHVLLQPALGRIVRLRFQGGDLLAVTYAGGRVAITSLAEERPGPIVQVGHLR